MQIVQALIARIRALFTWWFADIKKRPSIIGKAASLFIGLFVLCCVCTFGLAGARATGQAVGLVATNTPKPVATNTALPTNTPEVADTPLATQAPEPTAAPAPTDVPATDAPAPTDTPIPTKAVVIAPTKQPIVVANPTDAPAAAEPTVAPVVEPTPVLAEPTPVPAPSGPVYTGPADNQRVDPPYWPCKEGQIKGNNNSMIYHVPTGRDYSKTFKNVTCFDTEAEAQAAGFRAAKR